MKRKKILTVILSLMISALMLAFSVITVVAYSSDEDPLVTLSYLNEVVIPKLKAELGASSQNGNNGSGNGNTGNNSNSGNNGNTGNSGDSGNNGKITSATKTAANVNTVKTGDTNNVLLWAALFVVSCAGMAGITVVAKKRK